MTDVEKPQDMTSSPLSSPAPCAPHERGLLDPSSSPNENLSPSRKAILDRFNNITMGPPLTQPDFSKKSAPPSEQTSPGRRSPFKRALLNSQRVNTVHRSTPSSTDKSSSSSGAAESSFSIRLSANTSMDYDLMKDDSFLAEARQMGEESFDRKLRQQVQLSRRSPGKVAGPSAAPRQSPMKTAAVASPTPASPFVKPEKGNALGLGFPSPSPLASSTNAQRSTSGTRSFSLISETSNIFDEKGEESLLYASMRIKAKDGARGGLKSQKLLDALAEGREEDVLPASTPSGQTAGAREPLPAAAASKVATAFKSPASRTGVTDISRPSTASSSAASRAMSSIVAPKPGPQMTASSSRERIGVSTATTATRRAPLVSGPSPSTVKRAPVPLSTPRTSRPSAATSSSTGTAHPTAAASTPRSRPPLNASAARMRRLSALPQLMDEQGKSKTPLGLRSSVRTVGARPVATSAYSTSSPARTKADGTPGTIARPSVGLTVRSAAQPRASVTSRAPAHRSQDSPKATRAVATPRKVEPAVALTGQLHRRTSSVPSQEEASPKSTLMVHRPARPFLLGKGTNQTSNGSATKPSSPRRAPPTAPASARKSIATTTTGVPAPRVAGRLGIPKSSSASQVGTMATGSRTSRVGGELPTPVRSTGLPRPSMARAGADDK